MCIVVVVVVVVRYWRFVQHTLNEQFPRFVYCAYEQKKKNKTLS